MTDRLYFYAWGNNPKRATLKGKRCRLVVCGRMNSALVEFETGKREIVDRRALRRTTARTRSGGSKWPRPESPTATESAT